MLLPIGAQARDRHITIPATTLDIALSALARETGTDIISTEPALSRVRVPAIDGELPVRAALDRLLRNSGYHAVAIDPRSFRVVRDAPTSPARHPAPAPRPAPIAAPDTGDEIVVSASKQRITLLRYPGSVFVAGGTAFHPAAPSADLATVAQATPVLQHTELGPGRNKIFIRGIADSSFVGAAQSTASLYFGDVQLNYSGADPGIRLYDMKSVEVLEGPQGTLYGSGSIGGVIRLTPNPVDLDRAGGSVAGGVTVSAGAAPGFDLSGVLNLPIARDAAGVRVVGYRIHDGGYIDDPGRNVTNVNGADTVGGRIALLAEPGDGWAVQVGGLAQRIDVADAQYADRSVGTLSRRSQLAQPFRSDIALARLVVTKDWPSGLQLVSATGLVGSRAHDLFDATIVPVGAAPGSTPVIVYQTDGSKLLLTHEMRLSRSIGNGSSWVTGFTLLRDRDTQSRAFGPLSAPSEIIGVTNVTQSASLFAEGTLAVTSNLAATLGARLTIARTDGEPSTQPRSSSFIRGRSTRRLDPTFALSWRLQPALAIFARVQSGYRTGGLAVARGIGRVADFRSDAIVVGEIGIRKLRHHATGLALSAALSHARWTNIQADLVNRRGLPYTDNIGDATIQAFEGTADWVPIAGLSASLSFLATHNRVTGPLAASSDPVNRRLPETPPFAATSQIGYEWPIGPDSRLNVAASASYTGRSVLGTGDLLDISQGRYATLGLSGGWRWRRMTTSLTIDNARDGRENRFASGNPLTFAARNQTTPLRPINARLGVAVDF